MSAIDLSSFPQALAQNVERIDPQTGLATQPTLDNEFFLANWVKENTQALDHAVILAQSTAEDAAADVVIEALARSDGDAALSADVTFEATARATADSSLASAIITSEARSTGGSEATAQMQLVATAGVAGASAEFSWRLHASGSDYPVGMTAYVGGGVGSIAFTAQQFSLTDPSYLGGAPGNVFAYTGGVFRFNVPVELDTGEIAPFAISDMAANAGTITSSALTVSKSFYGGTTALVTVMLAPASGVSPTAGDANSITQRSYGFYVDGVAYGTPLTAYDVCIGSNSETVRNVIDTGAESVVGSLLFYPQAATKQFVVTGLSAGVHTFGVEETYGLAMSATVTVQEYKDQR